MSNRLRDKEGWKNPHNYLCLEHSERKVVKNEKKFQMVYWYNGATYFGGWKHVSCGLQSNAKKSARSF